MVSPAQALRKPSVSKLSEIISSESSQAYRWAVLLLVGILFALEAMLILGGAPPIDEPWDTSLLLGGGWRIVSGQVPHTSFHNPIGPLSYLLVAFGMKVAAPSASSIAYGSALLLAILLPWSWYIASSRLPALTAFVFVMFAGFFLVSPRPPSFGIRETSYAMIYNRQAYVLLAMLLLSVFLRPLVTAKRPLWIEGSLVGLLLGLLLYCKITYFLAAVILTIVAVLLESQPLRWCISLVSGFAVICTAFFGLLHISLRSYISDIASAGQSQSPRMRVALLITGVRENATWIYILLFCLMVWTWVTRTRQRPGGVYSGRLWYVAGAIVAGAFFILSGNAAQYKGEDPLYFITALILVELFRRQNDLGLSEGAGTNRFVYTATLMLMLPIFCCTILAREVASCAYVMKWDVTERPHLAESQRIQSAGLRDFYVPTSSEHNTVYWPAREYPARMNDGIRLLRTYAKTGDRVTTMGYSDPFSFALGSMPARDGLLWWRPQFSYDKAHHLPAEAFLGDASLVMVPVTTHSDAVISMDTVEPLLDLYGTYLHSNFRQIAATDTWLLYRRNSQ